MLKEWANFLMLARHPQRQKPCPAQSFQNAEQGFAKTKIETLSNYGFVGAAVDAGVTAAAGAAPPSFGVAR
jgi:hypothetical protein